MLNKLNHVSQLPDTKVAEFDMDNSKIWQLAGFPASGGLTLIHELQKGLSIDVLSRLNKGLDLSKRYLLEVTGINERSLARRKNSEDRRLKPEESERVARLVRIMDLAIELFEGDRQHAIEWLNTPVIVLGNQKPIDMLSTETGALEVTNLMGRLEHGVFA